MSAHCGRPHRPDSMTTFRIRPEAIERPKLGAKQKFFARPPFHHCESFIERRDARGINAPGHRRPGSPRHGRCGSKASLIVINQPFLQCAPETLDRLSLLARKEWCPCSAIELQTLRSVEKVLAVRRQSLRGRSGIKESCPLSTHEWSLTERNTLPADGLP
jgi:hypothetical protein